MKDYLIIESEGVYQSSLRGLELALELAKQEYNVIVWLVQDAIELLQFSTPELLTSCITQNNIAVYIDDFSMVQRGFDRNNMACLEVTVSSIDQLSEHLMAKNTKAIWH